MELTWKERLTLEPELRDINNWPFFDNHRLSNENRRSYQKNLRIVCGVLAGRSLKDVSNEVGVSSVRVSQLMTRCLSGPEDAPPALTQGLVPYQQVKTPKRTSSLGTLTKPVGDKCAFRYLLDNVPGLEDHLLKQIRLAANRNRRGQNLYPRALHAQFIAFLDSQKWPKDSYPYTSVSRGYESIRRFLQLNKADLLMPQGSKRVTGPRAAQVFAFREIQIDEAHIDCNGSAAIVLHNQMKPIRLARVSLLLARDSATGCYLGSTIALSGHPSTADVLALLEQLIQPWQPLDLTTPGLSYQVEIGFPSALDEAFCRPAFGIVRLDNALSHLSHQVRRMVCEHLGATCNFGLPKSPKARALIEQAFKRLNIDIHRFPSTTGSHPTDPVREPNKAQKKPPYVSLRALEEAISVLVTEFNHRPLANQGGVTPMEQMEYQLVNHLLPLRATSIGPGLTPFERMKTVTVRKGFTAQTPRINFEGCQYEGPALNKAVLIGQKVTIIFDIRDIRQLHVTSMEGKALGKVWAPKTWQRFAHSISVRKRINHLIKADIFSRRDPLGDYFNYTMAHHHLPKEALTLVGLLNPVSSEASLSSDKPEVKEVTALKTPELDAALARLPDWNTKMAKKRK